MAIHGLKNIALAVGLLVIASTVYAQPVPPTAPKLPTRPAPVSGKVAMDPAAVALHPAAATPVVATSTARQVAPPSNPNEPLLKPEAEHAGAASHPAPVAVAPSAAQGKPHIDHTEGKKKVPVASKGSKKLSKLPGHAHVEKAGAAGHHKKRGSKGKAEKVAQADTKQAHGVAATKHGKKATAKAHSPKDKAAKSHDVAHHAARHAKAAASAPTVSTARELTADAHLKKHAVKKGAHKAGAHHAKVVAKAASQSDHVSALKPAVKQKKKAPSAHAPA